MQMKMENNKMNEIYQELCTFLISLFEGMHYFKLPLKESNDESKKKTTKKKIKKKKKHYCIMLNGRTIECIYDLKR